MYHDGANGYLTNGSGAFHIRNSNVRLQILQGKTIFLVITNGSVELYYDNSKKFETTGYGVTITGGMYASGIIPVVQLSILNQHQMWDRALVIDSANMVTDNNKHITLIGGGPNGIDFRDLGDSDGLKIVYRTTPDQLKIENSEDSTSHFSVDRDDGQVQLNYGGSTKLATTGGGINVTGVVTATEFSGDTVTFTNLEKSNIENDGELGFDSSQGLILRRIQQGVSNATVTVLDGANVSAGSGMSITNLGSGDTGTGQIVFSVDLSTYAITSNQLLTLTNSSTCIDASGHIVSGKGSGGVALTINDGYGNANVTFNHLGGVPEQTGNALRIETNTDGTSNPTFVFEGKTISSTVAQSLTTMMTLNENDGLTVSSNGGRINCGQIMFDDGNASLDDYEEGTWTPSYSATSLTGITYDQRNGGYVKIGNAVYIWGRLRTDTLTFLN